MLYGKNTRYRSSKKECAKACIAAGSPVGILHGNDITAPLYMAVLSGNGSTYHSANEKLLRHINKQVQVTGRLIQRGKIEMLEIISIKPAE